MSEVFSYLSSGGIKEYVTVCHGSGVVEIEDSTGSSVDIYTEDIEQLIKALQAAYDHIQKGK